MKTSFRFFLYFMLFALVVFFAYAQASTLTTYLNDTNQYSSSANTTLYFNATGENTNLSFNMTPIHTFEGKSTPDSNDWVLEYVSSNSTEYLLKLVIDDQAATENDRILLYECTNNTYTVLCQDVSCGQADFGKLSNYTISFYSNNTFSIFVANTSNPKQVSSTLCANAAGMSAVKFSPFVAGLTQYDVKNNLVMAENISATKADLEILEIIPIQVVRGVDMVLGKTGLIRVNVRNNGPADANATVTVRFENSLLDNWDNSSTKNVMKFMIANQNESFDFMFKPNVTGTQMFVTNVSVG